MLVQPDPPPSKPILKNPMVYSSIALAIVVLAVGWILVSVGWKIAVLKGEPEKSEL